MGAKAGHQHRPTVAVVAGVIDVLHGGCEVDAAPRVHGVIRLDNFFAPVAEPAIAEEKTVPAIGEIRLMIFADRVGDEGNSGSILLAMPPCAIGADAFGESLIDFGVSEGLGLAVIPAETSERSQMACEVLLEVDSESIFARDAPGMICDLRDELRSWSGMIFELSDSVAIDAHICVIREGQETDDASFLRN